MKRGQRPCDEIKKHALTYEEARRGTECTSKRRTDSETRIIKGIDRSYYCSFSGLQTPQLWERKTCAVI